MTGLRWLAAGGVACAAGLVYAGVWHWYGLRAAAGDWPVPPGTPWEYQLESGFIPALTVVSLATLLGGAWHHVNCHQERCWRIGKHKVNGSPWCGRHHQGARERASASLDDVVARLDALTAILERERR